MSVLLLPAKHIETHEFLKAKLPFHAEPHAQLKKYVELKGSGNAHLRSSARSSHEKVQHVSMQPHWC